MITVESLNVYYGRDRRIHALKDVSVDIERNKITALIGPSGCGKTTFLRSLNRMIDFYDAHVEGRVIVDGVDIYNDGVDVNEVRRKVGMVFQKPNPFPMSIYDNVAYGPRIHGVDDDEIDRIVKDCLKRVGLWDEVKDRLNESALKLSGGQQQRLCIARALAVNPDVLLLDEPCSSLDPISTSKIEKLLLELKEDYTIVIVTHNIQQAARISDYTAFFFMGKLIEYDKTEKIFEQPENDLTKEYITGKMG